MGGFLTIQMKVGISGGIGSGKSYLSEIIASKGFPVYYSDLAARRLMNEDPLIKEQLVSLFGEEVYVNDQLNRPFLASIIFNDSEKREQVNHIVHPRVHQDFLKWVSHQHSKIVFYESALLFENKAYELFDATILVTAPLELKIERIVKRDSCTREQAVARINSQRNEEEYKELATYIIENDERSDIRIALENILKSFYSTSS